MQQKLSNLVRSRKFWAALAGLLAVSLRGILPDFPLEDEQMSQLVILLVSYILGTAIEDAGRGDYLTVLPAVKSLPAAGKTQSNGDRQTHARL